MYHRWNRLGKEEEGEIKRGVKLLVSKKIAYEGPYPFLVRQYFDQKMLAKLGYVFPLDELDALTETVFRCCAIGENMASEKG